MRYLSSFVLAMKPSDGTALASLPETCAVAEIDPMRAKTPNKSTFLKFLMTNTYEPECVVGSAEPA